MLLLLTMPESRTQRMRSWEPGEASREQSRRPTQPSVLVCWKQNGTNWPLIFRAGLEKHQSWKSQQCLSYHRNVSVCSLVLPLLRSNDWYSNWNNHRQTLFFSDVFKIVLVKITFLLLAFQAYLWTNFFFLRGNLPQNKLQNGKNLFCSKGIQQWKMKVGQIFFARNIHDDLTTVSAFEK